MTVGQERSTPMVTIELTQEEAELMRNMAENCLEDLRQEIRHTDKRDYRELLKAQEELLKKLLGHLQREAVPA